MSPPNRTYFWAEGTLETTTETRLRKEVESLRRQLEAAQEHQALSQALVQDSLAAARELGRVHQWLNDVEAHARTVAIGDETSIGIQRVSTYALLTWCTRQVRAALEKGEDA
jgi:hypothetical protein